MALRNNPYVVSLKNVPDGLLTYQYFNFKKRFTTTSRTFLCLLLPHSAALSSSTYHIRLNHFGAMSFCHCVVNLDILGAQCITLITVKRTIDISMGTTISKKHSFLALPHSLGTQFSQVNCFWTQDTTLMFLDARHYPFPLSLPRKKYLLVGMLLGVFHLVGLKNRSEHRTQSGVLV